MTADGVAGRAFALDLPHGRAVAVAIGEAGDVDDAGDASPAAERAAAARYGDRRAREYLAGRRALRAALADLGVGPIDAIAADDRGAPRLPPTVVGSISHKGSLAIAVAAPAEGWTLGIDLEARAPRRVDISRRVLTPAEAAAVAHLDADGRARAVLRTFSIKEAVYKAIDPYLRRYVGFLEVEVHQRDGGVVVVAPDAWGLTIAAACQAHDDHWIATARARRR
ncbi:MAG: 4'-phosphopantetheinyl transferase superfamily protein [Kofleriaceae bacterium]